jgi:ABC-type nitrate/sulfonate/bicarbonate transport system permease component
VGGTCGLSLASGAVAMSETGTLPAGVVASSDGTSPAKRVWQRLEPVLLGAGSIVALLAVWELIPHLVTISAGTRLFFTTPSQIAGTLWSMFASGAIWAPLGVSASGFALGLALAIVVGLPLGILIGRSQILNAMLDPFITAFNATPRLVFLPLIVLWLGLGLWSKVVIVFIGALFPILINTYEGVRNADKLLINVVRSFGAKELEIARLVVVPNALPYIVAGVRLAIGRAVLGVVVAEFFGSEAGLGVMMVQAAGRYQVDVVFSGLIVFAALSLIMTGLVQVVENRLARWRPQPQGSA